MKNKTLQRLCIVSVVRSLFQWAQCCCLSLSFGRCPCRWGRASRGRQLSSPLVVLQTAAVEKPAPALGRPWVRLPAWVPPAYSSGQPCGGACHTSRTAGRGTAPVCRNVAPLAAYRGKERLSGSTLMGFNHILSLAWYHLQYERRFRRLKPYKSVCVYITHLKLSARWWHTLCPQGCRALADIFLTS